MLTALNILDVELAGREKVDTGDGAVANGNLTLACVDVNSGEVVEVLEEGAVRGTHGKLHLGQLGEDTEESHLSLCHSHLSEDTGRGLACEHFYYYLIYYNSYKIIYITTL